MIVKIPRQEAIDKYPNLPVRKWNPVEDEYDDHFPKTYGNHVLTLPSKSYRGHFKLLGTELAGLAKNYGLDKLIFLGDIETPWLKRESDFKPAKEGLQYLVTNKVNKRFNGALQVDVTQLPAFILHLAWLVRTNTVLGYIYFIDPDQSFIGNICQYGNLHFSTINKVADERLKSQILKTKFEFMTGSNCYNKFSKSGVITGRQISL